MRIVMDLQAAQTEQRFGRIGRHSLALARALVRNRGGHEVFIVLNGLLQEGIEPVRAAFEGELPQDCIRVWYAPGPVCACRPENDWRRQAAELAREAFLADLRPDLILVANLFEGYEENGVTSIGKLTGTTPTVVLLHDCDPAPHHGILLKKDRLYRRLHEEKREYLNRAAGWVGIFADAKTGQETAAGLAPECGFEILAGQAAELDAAAWDRQALQVWEWFPTLSKSCREHPDLDESAYESVLAEVAQIRTAVPDEQDLVMLAGALAKNHCRRLDHKLFVNVTGLVQLDHKTGIQRVVRSILKELLTCPPEGYLVEPVQAIPGELGYRSTACLDYQTDEVPDAVCGEGLIDVQPGDIFLGLDLQHETVVKQEKYLQALYHNGVKVYFVVYDLLPILMPEYFIEHTDVWHRRWLRSISRYEGIICISRAVADEYVDWLAQDAPERCRTLQIGYFHLGADMENSLPSRGLPPDAGSVLAALAERTSFLMVGTIEPRKGHVQVLTAFEELWRQGLAVNLVIVGKSGWKMDPFIQHLQSHPMRDKYLFWLDGISDEYLEKVYAAATCLIAGSEGEGFGLPLIEAAQKQLPIIARDIPVFREVAGEYAFYFQGKDPTALANALSEWLSQQRDGIHPKSDGMPWLTWKKSAEQLQRRLLAGEWYKSIPGKGVRQQGNDGSIG